MKEFNLERALAGDPVVTRDGRIAKILSNKSGHPTHNIVGEILGSEGTFALRWRPDGSYNAGEDEVDLDLFMAPVKKQEWVNIYKDADTMSGYHVGDLTFSTKEQAETCNATATYVASVLIREWEE